MMNHLIETTMLSDTQRTYDLNIGVGLSDLTDEELRLLFDSKNYQLNAERQRYWNMVHETNRIIGKVIEMLGKDHEVVETLLYPWVEEDEEED